MKKIIAITALLAMTTLPTFADHKGGGENKANPAPKAPPVNRAQQAGKLIEQGVNDRMRNGMSYDQALKATYDVLRNPNNKFGAEGKELSSKEMSQGLAEVQNQVNKLDFEKSTLSEEAQQKIFKKKMKLGKVDIKTAMKKYYASIDGKLPNAKTPKEAAAREALRKKLTKKKSVKVGVYVDMDKELTKELQKSGLVDAKGKLTKKGEKELLKPGFAMDTHIEGIGLITVTSHLLPYKGKNTATIDKLIPVDADTIDKTSIPTDKGQKVYVEKEHYLIGKWDNASIDIKKIVERKEVKKDKKKKTN